MKTKQAVGFAGVGTMGSGMCRNLVKAGFPLFVYNRTKTKAAAIAGARVVSTPAELCTQVDIIITCVTNDAALKEVLFSHQGIMSMISSKNILVDCSTTSVAFTEEIATKCTEKNVQFLDAPLTGSKKAADEGTLLMMIGGDRKTLDACMPVFNAIGKRFVYCGLNTSGQRIKIALNVTQGMILESYLEGVMLALKEGVPLTAIQEVFDNAGPKNTVATVKMPTILQRDFTPHFLLSLMDKDMKLAKQEIEKLGLCLPLADAVIKIYQETMDKGLANEDWSSTVKLLEQKNGVKVQKGKS